MRFALKKDGGRLRLPRISLGSPAVLIFSALCVLATALDALTHGGAGEKLFSVYRASLSDPLTYVRCVCHVFGHADMEHLTGNLMLVMVLGPLLEERYGSLRLAGVMLATAVVTGVCTMLFFPEIRLMGASGVVFAMLLLASFTRREEHTIPLTFLLAAALYLWQQISQGLFTADNVAQWAHIVGGITGTAFGLVFSKKK